MQSQDNLPVFFSYLGFLGIAPPFFAYFFLAHSTYARFHAQQGIFLTFFFLLGSVLLGGAHYASMYYRYPFHVNSMIAGSWFGSYFVLNILVGIPALMGKVVKVPILSSFVRLRPLS